MEHLKIEDVLAYVSKTLPTGDSYELETHIADCDECAQTVRTLFLLTQKSDRIPEPVTVKECAKALVELRLRECISEVRIRPEFAARMKVWLQNIEHETGGAVGLKMDPALKRISVNPDKLKTFSQLGKTPCFTPVEQEKVPAKEGEEFVKSLTGRGEQGEAVTVYGSPGKATLKIESSGPKGPSPMAVLLRLDKKEVYINEIVASPPTKYALAEFEDLPKGEYVLLWQSSETKKKH